MLVAEDDESNKEGWNVWRDGSQLMVDRAIPVTCCLYSNTESFASESRVAPLLVGKAQPRELKVSPKEVRNKKQGDQLR